MFICTLDAPPIARSIRRMNSNEWMEKAEQLRSELSRLRAEREQGESAIMERAAIAQWLRREFSDEPPEDTATLPLRFPRR